MPHYWRFQCPKLDWESIIPFYLNSSDAKLIDVVEYLMLHQHVSTPTRIRIGQNPSLLDLVLTKYPETISDLRILSPLAKSEHAQLYVKVWIAG